MAAVASWKKALAFCQILRRLYRVNINKSLMKVSSSKILNCNHYQCVGSFNNTLCNSKNQGSHKEERRHQKDGYIWLSFVISLVYADSFKSKKAEDENTSVSAKIKDADEFYDANKTSELYHLLSGSKDCENADLLWRFARAARDYSTLDGISYEEKKELTFEAFKAAEKAVKLDENSFAAHKWNGIMLSEVGDYQGTRIKIENSYLIRDHFMKAIELNPSDATSHYLLGMWYFTFADLPWYQKKLAATIFASPPNCTYKEAEEHFLHAESIDPGFYTANQLMLAKTYIRLGKKAEAIRWINKLLENPGKTPKDAKNVAEAKNLLRSL